jgi:hypothetical protein
MNALKKRSIYFAYAFKDSNKNIYGNFIETRMQPEELTSFPLPHLTLSC